MLQGLVQKTQMVLSRDLSVNKLTKMIMKRFEFMLWVTFKDLLRSRKWNLQCVAFPCPFLNDLILLLMNAFLLYAFSFHFYWHPSANRRNYDIQRLHMFLDAFPSFPFIWILLHINHIQNFVSASPHINLNWIHTICIKITILTSICILVDFCIRVVVWMDFEISNSIKNFVKNFTQSQPVRANLRSV